MAEKKIAELSQFDAEEVSVVEEGANLKPRFPVIKSKALRSVHKACVDHEASDEISVMEIVSKRVNEAGAEAIRSALRILDAHKNDIPAEILEGLKAAIAPQAEEKTEEEETKPEVSHMADQEVNKSLEDAHKALEDTRKMLAAEISERVTREFVEKAKATMPNVGAPDEVAAVLKAVHTLDSELGAKVEKIFKQASDRIAPVLGKEHGSSRAAPTDNFLEVAVSEARKEAAASGKSFSSLIAKSIKSNARAYEEYERSAGRVR